MVPMIPICYTLLCLVRFWINLSSPGASRSSLVRLGFGSTADRMYKMAQKMESTASSISVERIGLLKAQRRLRTVT